MNELRHSQLGWPQTVTTLNIRRRFPN